MPKVVAWICLAGRLFPAQPDMPDHGEVEHGPAHLAFCLSVSTFWHTCCLDDIVIDYSNAHEMKC